jgi:uncharacterized protein (DUF952 family)
VIYHVALQREWEAAEPEGRYAVSSVGRSLADEGFIHASHRHQVDGVLERFYGEVTEPLVLLHIEPAGLGCEVIEEAPAGATERFPHIYGPIPVDAVVAVTPVRRAPTAADG